MTTSLEIVANHVIPDIKILRTKPFVDHRGSFVETFRSTKNLKISFVQSNTSISEPYVLRGLHSATKHAQGKLICVRKGWILDVAVDARPKSSTFGRHVGYALDSSSGSLYVPPGFLHGFLVGEKGATVDYHCTDFYYDEYAFSVNWADPDIGIEWCLINGKKPILSDKDANAPFLRDIPHLTKAYNAKYSRP